MKHKSNITRLALVAGFALFYLAVTVPAVRTYPQFQTKAKEMGFPSNDCTYCHTSPAGGAGHNARGLWLVEQKKVRNANQVDVAWLKDYKAGAAKGAKAPAKGKRPARKTAR